MRKVVSVRFRLLLVPALSFCGAVNGQMSTVSRFPGGVLDASKGMGFTSRADGSLAAIDLKNGRQVWRSDAAKSALGLSAGRIVAVDYKAPIAGAFTVVLLNPESGAVLARSKEISLGSGSSMQAGAPRFESRSIGKQELIRWKTQPPLSRAAFSSLRQATVPPVETIHTLTLDPLNGQVGSVDETVPAQRNRATGSIPYLRDSEWGDSEWASSPWQTSTGTAELVQEGSGTLAELKLRVSATSGKTLETSVGLREEVGDPVVTRDGMYLLAGTGRVSGAKNVFAASDGSKAGTVSVPLGARDICVNGGRLYFRQTAGQPGEMRVTALDLKTGAELWSYSLGAVAAGNPPPHSAVAYAPGGTWERSILNAPRP